MFWGPKGKRIETINKYYTTKRINLISCIGLKGLVSYRMIEENTDTYAFSDFILECVIPNIPIGSVIILAMLPFTKHVILKR